MITEKTQACAFFNEKIGKCKIYRTENFDCSRCMAFHVYEKAPHNEEQVFIPSEDDEDDD